MFTRSVQSRESNMIVLRQVSVNGQMTTVLATGSGMTLYYYKSDPVPNSACTGDCAKNWPPLLSNGGNIITTVNFPAQLTIQKTANGNQIEYDGHPLYTYAGDMAPGQIKGQGAANVWYVISISLQRQHW